MKYPNSILLVLIGSISLCFGACKSKVESPVDSEEDPKENSIPKILGDSQKFIADFELRRDSSLRLDRCQQYFPKNTDLCTISKQCSQKVTAQIEKDYKHKTQIPGSKKQLLLDKINYLGKLADAYSFNEETIYKAVKNIELANKEAKNLSDGCLSRLV